MKTRATTLMLAVLLALLALPFAAGAQPGNRQGHDAGAILSNPRALARYLKLTPDQVTQMQKFFNELRAAVEPLRQAEKPLREAFYNDLEAASPNACTIGQDAIALHENQEKIRAAFADFDRKFSAILTPEQLAKWEALKEAAHLFGGDGHGL